MRKKWERRDVLLLLILIALCADIVMRLPVTRAIAESFRLDTCVTSKIKDKPETYMHVVAHPSAD